MRSNCYDLLPQLQAWRRDFHRHAETAWQEVRTASIIAKELASLGYDLKVGREVIVPEDRMGLPSQAVLDAAYPRALTQGAPPEWAVLLQNGFTGVVGDIDFGKPGPTIVFRFDIDANDLCESNDQSHRPVELGFASINSGMSHGCGHDGHAAIGLGLATVLAAHRNKLCGKVRLVFQPAEEGARGAKPMVSAGVMDGADYFLSGHIGFGAKQNGEIACGTSGFLATSKADVYFTGIGAHAGASPEQGRNALLAAASTSLALHALPRHSAGASRVNVGILKAGEGRNVIAPSAYLAFETRGETSAIDAFMMAEAQRIIEGQALAFGVKAEVKAMGGALGTESDPDLVRRIMDVVSNIPEVTTVRANADLNGSEDVSYMMHRVKEQGGKASYLMFGTQIAAPHHNALFDFDESVLPLAVYIYASMIEYLCR